MISWTVYNPGCFAVAAYNDTQFPGITTSGKSPMKITKKKDPIRSPEVRPME